MIEEPPNGRATIREVYDLVGRVDARVDARLGRIEEKLDQTMTRLDRTEGALTLIRWLLSAGIIGALASILNVIRFSP